MANRPLGWLVGCRGGHGEVESPDLAPEPARSGLRVLASTPYLRDLATVTFLSTVSAALLTYVFKVQAVAAFGQSEALLRFFALYYTAVSLFTFVIQTSGSRWALEKLGLAATAGTPSLALLLGGAGALVSPGLTSVVVARGGESVFRASLFRPAYELFYTPVSSRDKRAAKSIIDVAFDRLGEAVGGGAVRLLLLLAPARQYAAIVWLAVAFAGVALVFTRRLNRGYVRTLERSLLSRALELDLSEVEDGTTRTTMFQMLSTHLPRGLAPVAARAADERLASAVVGAEINDPEVRKIVDLRSLAGTVC